MFSKTFGVRRLVSPNLYRRKRIKEQPKQAKTPSYGVCLRCGCVFERMGSNGARQKFCNSICSRDYWDQKRAEHRHAMQGDCLAEPFGTNRASKIHTWIAALPARTRIQTQQHSHQPPEYGQLDHLHGSNRCTMPCTASCSCVRCFMGMKRGCRCCGRRAAARRATHICGYTARPATRGGTLRCMNIPPTATRKTRQHSCRGFKGICIRMAIRATIR